MDSRTSRPHFSALGLAAAALLISGVIVLAFVMSRSATREHAQDREDALAESTSSAIESDGLLAPLVASVPTRANEGIATDAQQRGLQLVVLARVDASSPTLLPGIRMVVGIGQPPLGGENGSFLRSGLALDLCDTPYHEVVSDDSGRATFDFSADELDAARGDGAARVWVRVVEPGRQERTYPRRLPAAGVDTIEIPVFVAPGLTLRGRVVDESGAPVAAQVRARAFDFEGKLGLGSMGWSGADGWFELFPFRAGVQHLLADAGERGTAALRDLDLDAARAEPIVLRVNGPGIVRGRVLDDAGRAVPALELGIWIPSIDDERGSTAFPPHALDRAELEGRGRAWATVRTDANGTFAARGLRADTYVVRAGDDADGPFPVRLTTSHVPSDGVPIELRLQRTYLAVKVVDEFGEPWTGGLSLGTPAAWGGRAYARPTNKWPEGNTLVVARARASALPGEDAEERIEGQLAGDEYVFIVSEEAHLRIGMIGGTQTWNPIDVHVPSLAGRVEVTVAATSCNVRGKLSIVVRDTEGKTLTGACSIRIEDVDDGATLMFDDLREEGGSPRVHRLPEGRYRVVVQGEPLIEHFHGTVLAQGKRCRFEDVIDVQRDVTTDLVAVLPAGARIQLTLAGEVSDAGRQALRERYPNWPTGEWFDEFVGRATTTLVRADRRPIPVRFPYEIRSTSAAGTHLGDFLTLGAEQTSEPLPTGSFELVARLADGREARAPVELLDGVTTRVALAFENAPEPARK